MHIRRKGIVAPAIVGLNFAVMVIAAGGYYLVSTPGNNSPLSQGSQPSQAVQTVEVVMPSGVGSNNQLNYQPGTTTVVIGVNSTVKWVDQDSGIHTVTANDWSFDSLDMAVGASYIHTFLSAGTYTYYCKYHSWMTGTVT